MSVFNPNDDEMREHQWIETLMRNLCGLLFVILLIAYAVASMLGYDVMALSK